MGTTATSAKLSPDAFTDIAKPIQNRSLANAMKVSWIKLEITFIQWDILIPSFRLDRDILQQPSLQTGMFHGQRILYQGRIKDDII